VTHVRARNIQFDRRHTRLAVEPRRHFHKLVVSPAGNADDNRRPQAGQIGQMMRDESLDPVIIQTDRVQHPGRGLDRAPRCIARARQLGDRFWKNSAQSPQIDKAFHLSGIAKCTRGDEDRIGQPQSS
jgi:hypothetical protein